MIVDFNALAILIAKSNLILRNSIALVGTQHIPLKGFPIILVYSHAELVAECQSLLGIEIAVLGRALVQLERACEVLFNTVTRVEAVTQVAVGG